MDQIVTDKADALPPYLALNRPAPDVTIDRDETGVVFVRSNTPVETPEPNLCLYLRRTAAAHPDRTFLAKRDGAGEWCALSYGDVLRQADAVAQWFISQGFGPDRPLLILSGNGLEHAAMTFGAMAAETVVVPVSPAYALMSKDFAKLRHIFELIRPGAIFVDDGAPFAAALAALDLAETTVIAVENLPDCPHTVSFETLLAMTPDPALADRVAGIRPETVAKIMFTSGSTGMPKGVINNHSMLCSALEMVRAIAEPIDPDNPSVLLDWLPWHHTFGGNAVLNSVVRSGSTLYIDAGRPVAGRFDATIDNLREISPTRFSSVPAALAMLADALEHDGELRQTFFRNLRSLLYGGAAMPQATYDRFQKLAIETIGMRIPFGSGYGMTETSSVNMSVSWATERMGLIGLPLPGTVLKLVPIGDKYEVRIKGDHVMPGYFREPEKTAAVFDEDGFFRTGDAARWADDMNSLQGLAFAGRVAEEFKLTSGTWVQTGTVRVSTLGALSPLIQDAVVTGENCDYLGLLLWPVAAACRSLCPDLPADAPLQEVLAQPAVRDAIRDRLRRYNASHGGGSTRVRRALLMAKPPSIDANEVTDKQYVNQRAVLANRADLVERLYAETPPADIIVV